MKSMFEKSMLKVNVFDSFSDTGPPRVISFCFFGRFGAMVKKHCPKYSKNLKKMVQGSPKGQPEQPEDSPAAQVQVAKVWQAATSATELVDS